MLVIFFILLLILVVFFSISIFVMRKQAVLLKQKNEELDNALHCIKLDALTGVYNSTHCGKTCSAVLADEENKTCAMLLLDVDNFKKMNAMFGYGYGDEVLQNIGANMTKLFPKGKIFGRVGNDKFLIFFTNTSVDEIKNIVSECKEQIALIFSKRNPYVVTCSIGVVLGTAGSISYYNFFVEADKALVIAKKNGNEGVYIDEKIYTEGGN